MRSQGWYPANPAKEFHLGYLSRLFRVRQCEAIRVYRRDPYLIRREGVHLLNRPTSPMRSGEAVRTSLTRTCSSSWKSLTSLC